jgi:predicted GIY-YIG superfamily endonuclease
MTWVYILKDEEGRIYIGSTDNLDKRIKQHKKGFSKSTKHFIKPRLALSQKYDTIFYARKVEEKLKNLKRRDYIEQIIEDGFIKMEP